jgi:hypothetical protein
LLEGGPSRGGKATQAAVAADDPVTRDEQGDGISGEGAAHGPGCSTPSYVGRQLAIGHGVAKCHLSTGPQDLPGKALDPLRDQGDVASEIDLVAFKVGNNPSLDFWKECRIVLDVLYSTEQLPEHPLPILKRKAGPVNPVPITGHTEETPGRGKDRVSHIHSSVVKKEVRSTK